MKRPIRPRYFKSRGAYFVQVGGKQILLARGPKDDPEVKEKAWAKFKEVTAEGYVPDKARGWPLYRLVGDYLNWYKAMVKESTFRTRSSILQSFVDYAPGARICDLRTFHMEKWLEKMSKFREVRGKWVRWGTDTRRTACEVVNSCFAWAVRTGLLSKRPFKPVPKPRGRSRGKEALLTKEQHILLCNYFRSRRTAAFADLLEVLWSTGARPAEVARRTAADFDPQLKAWVTTEGKNSRHGRVRVIYLTGPTLQLVEKLNKEHPTGPIFPTQRGGFYGPGAIKEKIRRARKVLSLPPALSAYSYRHTFATDWLKSGRPVGHLCQLLDTSVKMIERHYGHLYAHVEALRGASEGFSH
jgi:integrase